jgi:polyhydroxyalkanoate synthase subunit PhaC
MRYQYWTGDPPTDSLESCLEKTQQHPGSWWPDWQAWIEGLAGERVPAREIGAGLLKPIEDAPGSYVRVKG